MLFKRKPNLHHYSEDNVLQSLDEIRHYTKCPSKNVEFMTMFPHIECVVNYLYNNPDKILWLNDNRKIHVVDGYIQIETLELAPKSGICHK